MVGLLLIYQLMNQSIGTAIFHTQ